ncbi:hypothetical protein AC249_AIPGENE27548 [Exaiptasia diaphana]|nr:hypothetical protein AC249_AIPGENE27548 [Exaiptasia diaphana]
MAQYCTFDRVFSDALDDKKPTVDDIDQFENKEYLLWSEQELKKLKSDYTVLVSRYLVRWKNYGSKYDSWVDEDNVNNPVKLAYFRRNTGLQGIRQTLEVLISQKLNVRYCQAARGSVTVRVSVTMPMDPDTFTDIFGSLPSAPTDIRRRTRCRFTVPRASELDSVFSEGWSENTFKTSTTCRVMLDMPVVLSMFSTTKVFYDHSSCRRCVNNSFAEPCKPQRRVIKASSFMKMIFSRERSHKTQVAVDAGHPLTCSSLVALISQ